MHFAPGGLSPITVSENVPGITAGTYTVVSLLKGALCPFNINLLYRTGVKHMLEFIKVYFNKTRNVSNSVIFLMLTIYPLIVIPNSSDYFYFPRFIFLYILSSISIFTIIKGNYQKSLKRRNLYLILFIIFIILSSLFSKDKLTSLIGLYGLKSITVSAQKGNANILVDTARYTGAVTYIFCIILYLDSKYVINGEKLVKYMIYTCTLISILSIMQHFGFNIIPHESFRDEFHAYGTMGNPNFLGTYSVFILPASIFYAIKSEKIIWLIISSIIYAAMLVSLTRGVWISFFIILIIISIYCIKHRELKKRFFYLIVSLAIVTAILMPTKNGIIYKKILSIPDNITSGVSLEENAGAGRIGIWKETIKLIPKYWSLGIGPDNLIFAGIKYNNSIIDKAHNIYLEILVTMGVFTLIAYLLFLSTFIKKWDNDLSIMYSLMIFAYLVQGFFNIDVIMVLPLFWIILGFLAANEETQMFI